MDLPRDESAIVANAHRLMNPAILVAAIPESLTSLLHGAMVARGASAESARLATDKIGYALADWIFSGGHTYRSSNYKPEATQREEIQRVARDANTLLTALSNLSIDSHVRLSLSLSGERQGPWSGLDATRWNPDPIEIEVRSGGLLSRGTDGNGADEKIILPANLAAKLNRLRSDLASLAPALRRAGEFTPRKRGNEALSHLYRQCIQAWAIATGEWPSSGLKAAHDDDVKGRQAYRRTGWRSSNLGADSSSALSPIPSILRDMAKAILGDPPASMNDAAFLRVLKIENKTKVLRTGRRALFGGAALKTIRTPTRGRRRKKP